MSPLLADEAVDCIDPFLRGARCRVFQGMRGELLDGPRIELAVLSVVVRGMFFEPNQTQLD